MITTSHVIRASVFDEGWFKARAFELNLTLTGQQHRKYWELAAIAQVYHERYGLGGRGLGFGVGLEPLPAWFAARGCEILATDAPGENPDWKGQHAASLADCPRLFVDDETFASHVTHRAVDMTALPVDLTDGSWDFLWSTSTFEHIGGLTAGIEFVCQAMACLRPGGLAIHVTEFNPVNNKPTLDAHNIAFYRESDLRVLERSLQKQGDHLWPLVLDIGNDLVENYEPRCHQFVHVGEVTATSLLLVVEKG